MNISSIANARDFGGNSVGGGLKVREGLLLRSAHLAAASDADVAFLESLPTVKVIDFRRDEELSGVPDREIPGARYIRLPVDASGNAAATATGKEKKRFTRRKKFNVKKIIVMLSFNEKAQRVAEDLYPTLLFDPGCQRQFAAFLREVVDTPTGAVLFHCTQGKDRTGVASMLLLAALGAGKETILADFDATNRAYEKDVKKYSRRVRLVGGKGKEVAVVKTFLGANTVSFANALDELESRYGSMEGYLKGPMGLTDEDITILRERYLTT